MNAGTFKGIKPGDRVLFTSPRGTVRAGIATRLLCFPEHVVVNVGGLYGTPAVVNAGNYLRHVPRKPRTPAVRLGG